MYTSEFDYLNLTNKQRQAVDLIAADKTDVEVARLVGVTRETVNRWRHHDSTFKKTVLARRACLTADLLVNQTDDLSQLADAFQKYLPKKYCRLAMSYLPIKIIG